MEITKVFRGLVAGSLALFAISIFISFVEPPVPDEVNAYLEGEGASPLFSIFESGPLSLQILLGALMAGFLIAYLASCIGLLMFQRWARATFIGVAVVGIVVLPWEGVTFTTPLTSTIETLFSMIDGALLAMLLFDPIKSKFAKPA
ncbi:MAG TPA: hypothetical protein VFU13_24210 [Steroidobacteraceae bacterium]|nr:hypothetical protein [Steroidobacteraceae bacterium]